MATRGADRAGALLHLPEPFGHPGTDRQQRFEAASLGVLGFGDRPLRRLSLLGETAKVILDPSFGLAVQPTGIDPASSVVEPARSKYLALFSYMYQ